MRIGFVGAGRMGRPMVARLVAAGHDVRVLARTEPARKDLLDAGATPVGSLDEVADGAAAVLVCVHTDGQVREVCLDDGLVDAVPAGAVLIVHTTGSPRTVDALVERAGGRGIDVVDAPVSGGPHNIAAGSITVFVGGSDEALAKARPVLAAYADPILHVGARGSGQLVKLLNNAIFAANLGLIAEAVGLANQLGVAEPVLLDALRNGSAASRALDGVAARGSAALFVESVGEFIGKDVAVVRAVVGELGADLGALGTAHQILAGLVSVPEQASLLVATKSP